MADLNPAPRRGRPWLRIGVVVGVVIGAILLTRITPVGHYLSREGIQEGIGLLRGSAWAPVIFVGFYIAAVVVAAPASVLTLAGGALFGWFWGTVYNSIAANLGANLAFLVARRLGRGGIERFIGDHGGGRLERLDRAIEEHGFRALLTLRLLPVFPFNALNYLAGLTPITWRGYTLATLIGILPGTIVYTYFADALLQNARGASREALIHLLVAGALVILLTFLPGILRRMGLRPPTAPGLFLWCPLLLAGWGLGTGRIEAQEIPDHSTFTTVLSEVVVGNRVDYARLKEDRSDLDAYLRSLALTDPSRLAAGSESERIAFWVNAYNACMLAQVVDHYPIRPTRSLLGRIRNAITDRPANSVWQIDGVFDREFCEVAGEERSLDEIEHRILRPLGDPRIHFVVNCASVSCPPLGEAAMTPVRLDEQLDTAVREFVADSTQLRLVRNDPPVLHLNPILDWYGDDFGGPEGLRRFFARYLPRGDREVLLGEPALRLEFGEYDWTLNDLSGR